VTNITEISNTRKDGTKVKKGDKKLEQDEVKFKKKNKIRYDEIR
jgi:hypothetical protein